MSGKSTSDVIKNCNSYQIDPLLKILAFRVLAFHILAFHVEYEILAFHFEYEAN